MRKGYGRVVNLYEKNVAAEEEYDLVLHEYELAEKDAMPGRRKADLAGGLKSECGGFEG